LILTHRVTEFDKVLRTIFIRSRSRLQQRPNQKDNQDSFKQRPSWIVLVRAADVSCKDCGTWNFEERIFGRG
jgi:hypothetical protein